MMQFVVSVWALLVCLALQPSEAAKVDKPVGEKFYFASPEVMTWKEVATFCVRPEFNDRLRIAQVSSDAQHSLAADALKLVNEITGEVIDGWLGGYRVNLKWMWPNRDKFPFTKWGKKQPSTDPNLNCLALGNLTSNGNMKWLNANCLEKKRAICEGFGFSKLFSFVARDKSLDRPESEKECASRGGTVATILSSDEQDSVRDQTSRGSTDEPTPMPTKQPTTRSPTLKPTRNVRKCCANRLERECCYNDSEPPFACASCECCCCNPKWKLFKYQRCCKRTNFQMCGCKNSATPFPFLAGPSNTNVVTAKLSKEDEEEESESNENDFDLNRLPAAIASSVEQQEEFEIFLSARNDKVGFVKEENGSFVWSNGISFKAIGYLDRNVSEQFTNWETSPLPNTTHQCAVMSSKDGKWRSSPCDAKGRGAMCEFRTAKKRFQIYTHAVMSRNISGEFCAKTDGQLASIKTATDLATVQKLLKKINKQCGGCVQKVWLNGRRFLSNLYWSDGQIFFRGSIPIGLKNELEIGEPEGVCVAFDADGHWVLSGCSEQLFPLCEYDVPDKTRRSPPAVDPSACFPGCLPSFIGDGVCDPVCNHYSCDFDGDDCGQCAEGCSSTMLRNGQCDDACFNATCAFDTRDCFPDGEASRRLELIDAVETDIEVNSERNLAKKKLPAACSQTSNQCKAKWIGDKYCDLIACGRECDEADCQQVASTTKCSQSCRKADLFNDRCDKGCATLDCNFDGGLCPVSCDAACGNKITSNTCTKPQCDVPMCRFDIGLCRDDSDVSKRCSPNCPGSNLGNGRCDPECNNAACKWDAGDCPESDYCPFPLPFDEYGCIDQCNKPLFKFQRGACENTCITAQCRPEMLGNGVCDAACNNARCGMDGGDCAPCAAGCNPFELNNGICDPSCNSAGKCENDGGDCL